jgi:hypothetical protein
MPNVKNVNITISKAWAVLGIIPGNKGALAGVARVERGELTAMFDRQDMG